MARPIKRHLKVGGAPEDDEGMLVVRMHPEDLPRGIKWNRYIHLSAKNAKITCRVRNNERAEVPHPRIHQININKKLRERLGIRSGTVYDSFLCSAVPSEQDRKANYASQHTYGNCRGLSCYWRSFVLLPVVSMTASW